MRPVISLDQFQFITHQEIITQKHPKAKYDGLTREVLPQFIIFQLHSHRFQNQNGQTQLYKTAYFIKWREKRSLTNEDQLSTRNKIHKKLKILTNNCYTACTHDLFFPGG